MSYSLQQMLEAKEDIYSARCVSGTSKQIVDYLIKLHTPKKVKYIADSCYHNPEQSCWTYLCPNCDEELDHDNMTDYCSTCGQALNWEHIKEAEEEYDLGGE